MEHIKLTRSEGYDILGNANEDYVLVENEISYTSRWSIGCSLVIRRVSDDKLFIGWYTRGATESQEEQPWDYSDPEFDEAETYEKCITAYRKKEEA